MKKLRYLLLLILLMLLTIVPVSAGTGGSGDGGGGGGTGQGEVENPPSRRKTGYVYYIINGGGGIVAQPEFRVTGSEYPDASHVMAIKTRYGGSILPSPVGSMTGLAAWWNMEPFGANGSGNGGAIKNWMLTQTGPNEYNCLAFIDSVWGAGMKEAFITNDDYILCVEPVMWSSLYNCSTYMGNVCGNVIGWVAMRQAVGAPLGSSNSTYTVGNFPCSMFFDVPVLGVPAATKSIGPIPYEQQLSEGYGIIAVWSSEITGELPEKEVPPTTSIADALKSDELNYIYADFGGKRSGATLDIVKIDMKTAVANSKAAVEAKSTYVANSYEYSPTYEVSVSHSGSVWGHNGNNLFLYYSGSPKLDRAVWKISFADKIFDTDTEIAGPMYAYNLTRKMWNDDVIVCNYRIGEELSGNSGSWGNFAGIDGKLEYATSILKFSSGDKGVESPIHVGVNVDATYGVSLSDSVTFEASQDEWWQEELPNPEYESQKDAYDEAVAAGLPADEPTADETIIEDMDNTITIPGGTYSVTHWMDKYSARRNPSGGAENIDFVADNTSIGRQVQSSVGSAHPRVGFTSTGNSILKISPEILMKIYVQDANSEMGSIPTAEKIVVMGEYLRKCKPPVISYYRAGFTSGDNLTGKTYVDTALDGTKAFEWSKTWGRNVDGNTYQVCAQGSGFESYTTNNPKVDCTTIGLDVVDEITGQPVKAHWGNNYSPMGHHNSFVSNLVANTMSEVVMKRFNRGGSCIDREGYYMSFDISATQVSDTEEAAVLHLLVNNGTIVNKDECISFISTHCPGVDAGTLWSASGIEANVADMFVSGGETASRGTESGWYQEDTMALVLKCYKSTIVYGNIIFSDKSDYGMSTDQSSLDILRNEQSGVQVRFFYNLLHDENILNVEGHDFEVGGVKYLIKDSEIEGTRYLISDGTTADWRR